jgi:phytoene dehydrogenase-like protein
MVRRLESLGGELRTEHDVTGILASRGSARGVDTTRGAFTADAVVTDIDEAAVPALVGRAAKPREHSLSGLALLLGLRGDGAAAHHRITFPADYDAEFDDIFARRRMPLDPTRYVCVPSVTDPGDAPPGHEAWFVLVNAPAGAGHEAAEEALIDRLGVRERIVERTRVTPRELGPIYGAAPHGRLASIRRAGNRVRGIQGLWLTGGTVHPGGGLPLVTLGGRSVARQIGAA